MSIVEVGLGKTQLLGILRQGQTADNECDCYIYPNGALQDPCGAV